MTTYRSLSHFMLQPPPLLPQYAPLVLLLYSYSPLCPLFLTWNVLSRMYIVLEGNKKVRITKLEKLLKRTQKPGEKIDESCSGYGGKVRWDGQCRVRRGKNVAVARYVSYPSVSKAAAGYYHPTLCFSTSSCRVSHYVPELYVRRTRSLSRLLSLFLTPPTSLLPRTVRAVIVTTTGTTTSDGDGGGLGWWLGRNDKQQ